MEFIVSGDMEAEAKGPALKETAEVLALVKVSHWNVITRVGEKVTGVLPWLFQVLLNYFCWKEVLSSIKTKQDKTRHSFKIVAP